MVVLEKETILMDVAAASCEDVIRQGADCLHRLGYVGDVYVQDVLQRERDYPTGLPSDDVAIALPHAFSSDVKKTGVCVLSLQKPVEFANMAMPGSMLPVELVFLLANASGAESHLEDLQELMNSFSRVGLLSDLKQAKSPEEFIEIFDRRESYPEE